MREAKGFPRAIDICNKEMHTSSWFIRSMYEKYKEEYDKYKNMRFIRGQYFPNDVTPPEVKLQIWQYIQALTLVAKRRLLWDDVNGGLKEEKDPNKIIYLSDRLNQMGDIQEAEVIKTDPVVTKKGFIGILPGTIKWVKYWQDHPDEQVDMINHKQQLKLKKIEEKNNGKTQNRSTS
jgi:hypothetical protein